MDENSFIFVDGKEHDVTYPKAVIMRKPAEWKLFVEKLDSVIMEKYHIPITRHLGIPVKFPCIVFSNVITSTRNLEHYFVYPDDARILLDIDKQVNKRLARIERSMEENT